MQYIDIGHGRSEAVLWICFDGRIWTSNRGGTHDLVFGEFPHLTTARGRYEVKSGRLSMILPEHWGAHVTSEILIGNVKSIFPGYKEIYIFDADGVLLGKREAQHALANP